MTETIEHDVVTLYAVTALAANPPFLPHVDWTTGAGHEGTPWSVTLPVPAVADDDPSRGTEWAHSRRQVWATVGTRRVNDEGFELGGRDWHGPFKLCRLNEMNLYC